MSLLVVTDYLSGKGLHQSALINELIQLIMRHKLGVKALDLGPDRGNLALSETWTSEPTLKQICSFSYV